MACAFPGACKVAPFCSWCSARKQFYADNPWEKELEVVREINGQTIYGIQGDHVPHTYFGCPDYVRPSCSFCSPWLECDNEYGFQYIWDKPGRLDQCDVSGSSDDNAWMDAAFEEDDLEDHALMEETSSYEDSLMGEPPSYEDLLKEESDCHLAF